MHRSPPPSPPLSKQDEFARHGFREGYPLWNPDLVLLPQGHQNKGLEIGDIGIVKEDGCFFTVLNIYRWAPDPDLAGEPNIYVSETFETGHVFSSPETSWRNEESGAPYYTAPHTANHSRVITQYLSSLSEDGAHIIVPQGAKCFKLAPRDESLLESLVTDPGRCTTWFDLANHSLGSRPGTLRLVTGLCQARSWSLASFNRKNDQEVQVCCELVEEDGKLQLDRGGSRWTPRGRFEYKIGPSIERQGNYNQTIFIQTFSITPQDDMQSGRPRQLTTAVTRGKTMGRGTTASQTSNRGTNNNRRGFSGQHMGRFQGANSAAMSLATESTAVIQRTPTTFPAYHPSEIINRYLLAKQPSAHAAVTHDSLWINMLVKGQLSKLQDLETDLDELLAEHYLIILSNGVVYLKNNLSSLRRFGIESSVDLTDCVKHGDAPFSRHILGDIYQSTLNMPWQTIKVGTMLVKGNLRAKKQEPVQHMIELWSKLDHTNVLPLIPTIEVNGRLSLVFPWPENGTLTSYLDETHKKLTEVQILTLINDVASGLQYLHSKDTLHSGLSGSNIVVDGHGIALISVFGYTTPLDEMVSPLFAQLKRETDPVRWAAPESLGLWVTGRYSALRVLTKQSNVYSFGGLMLQILSGKLPYHYDRTRADIVSALFEKRIPQRPDAPRLTDRQWEFIKQCWSPPESRPSMTAVLEFCKRELSDAMDVVKPGLTLPTGIQSVPSGKPPVDTPSVTVSLPQESGQPSSGLLRLPATRVSGRSLTPASGQASTSPPGGLPATRLSGTSSTRVGSASLMPGGVSTTRLSGPPTRTSKMLMPLASEPRSSDASFKGKDK